MRCWIVTVGEPLPLDGDSARLLRSGILASVLANRGHNVTWWTSTFDHWTKTHRSDGHAQRRIAADYTLTLLRGCGYSRNVSIARIREHRQVASAFASLAAQSEVPDLIVCSLPTLELAVQAVRYGRKHGVPVVLDIRDMWPDAITRLVPKPLRVVGNIAVARMRRMAREACCGATAITGHAPAFVEWGLRHAGRGRRAVDKDFAFGYSRRILTEAEVISGTQFWNAQGLSKDPSVLQLVFAGTMSHSFEFEPLLKAAQRLTGIANFVICGAGDALTAVRRKSASLSNVICPGWIGEVELTALLARADIGLAPYRDELDFRLTIPNKGPEYLASALPIALSLATGPLFDAIVAGRCGFSYEGSADLLVSRITELFADRETLRQMSENARRVFDDRFRADVVYSEFADFLEQLIG